ncbi:MAG: hypothetical protein J0H78_05000 [Rhizobiales bacterium]|nr:hypothetical protein [Hyphomicrobiales bacterium]
MSSKRKVEKHLKALCAYWDGDEFHEALEIVRNVTDAILSARTELDNDGIEEICRAMYFGPDNFGRWMRIAVLQREIEESSAPPIFYKRRSMVPDRGYFGGQVGVALAERLRMLLVNHITAFEGGLVMRRQQSLSSQFNYGVRIVGLDEIGHRVFKMTVELGQELCDACGISSNPKPTAQVFFEVLADSIWEFKMSGDDAQRYLSRVYLDAMLVSLCLDSSADDGAALLAKVDEAVTAVTLGGQKSVEWIQA